jgi:3-phosphoglycerate kinase
VSTKLEVLRQMVTKVDHLIIGGGMANTFLRRAESRSASRCASMTCADRALDPGGGGRGRLHRPPAL